METPEDQLKRLLLSRELDLLQELRVRFDALSESIDDPETMRRRVQPVIVDLLRDAGQQDHERMARVLAPLVLASMREEIRNSKDLMVDALYPITGRLVAAAVGNAFRELMETLNQKLDSSLPVKRWAIQVKARAIGRPTAELVLQENMPFEIDHLLVIHRPTGLLITEQRSAVDQGNQIDSDLVSSMLTAVMAFVKDAVSQDGQGELSSLGFGDSQLFLRTSPAIILVAKAQGIKPAGFDRALEDLFVGLLERWGEQLRGFQGDLDEDERADIGRDLEQRFRSLEEERKRNFRKPSRVGRGLAIAAAVLLIGWFGYERYAAWRIADIEETAAAVISAQPDLSGFPLNARYDEIDGRLIVTGLIPDPASQQNLADGLDRALPDIRRDFQLSILSETRSSRAAKLEARLGELESEIEDRRDTLDKYAALADALLAEPGESPLQRLSGWTETHAIDFSEDLSLADPDRADVTLRALATLLRTAPPDRLVRIVGYGDDAQNSPANRQMSLARANAIADRLAAFGVDRARLATVGRGVEWTAGAPRSVAFPSRRVVFEMTDAN